MSTLIEPWNVPTAKIGAGAVVVHADQVLLVKVNYGPAKGNWILPGGRVEAGEGILPAVAREVYEESGVKIELQGLLAVRERKMQSGITDLYFLFAARAVDVPTPLKPQDPNEIIEVRFWPIAEALIAKDVRPMARAAIAMAGSSKSRFTPMLNPPDFPDGDLVLA
jgi:8-oxo-dGTP diphosphatase